VGPLANIQKKKLMVVNPDVVDVYASLTNEKTPEKRKETTY